MFSNNSPQGNSGSNYSNRVPLSPTPGFNFPNQNDFSSVSKVLKRATSLVRTCNMMIRMSSMRVSIEDVDNLIDEANKVKNLLLGINDEERIFKLQPEDVLDKKVSKIYKSCFLKLRRNRRSMDQKSKANQRSFQTVQRIDRNMIPVFRKSKKSTLQYSKEWFCFYSTYLLRLFKYPLSLSTMLIEILSKSNHYGDFIFNTALKARGINVKVKLGKVNKYQRAEYTYGQWYADIKTTQVRSITNQISRENAIYHHGPSNYEVGIASVRDDIQDEFGLRVWNKLYTAVFHGVREVVERVAKLVIGQEERARDEVEEEGEDVEMVKTLVFKHMIDGDRHGTTWKSCPCSKILGCNSTKYVINMASSMLKELKLVSLSDILSPIEAFNNLQRLNLDGHSLKILNLWINDFKMWKALFLFDPDFARMNPVIKSFVVVEILQTKELDEDDEYDCQSLLRLLNVSKSLSEDRQRIIQLKKTVRPLRENVVFNPETVSASVVLNAYNLRRSISMNDLNCVEDDVLACLYCYCSSVTRRFKYFFPRLLCWNFVRIKTVFKYGIRISMIIQDIVHEIERIYDALMDLTFPEREGSLLKNGPMETFTRFWWNVSPSYLKSQKQPPSYIRRVGPLKIRYEQKRHSENEVSEWGLISTHDYLIISFYKFLWYPLIMECRETEENGNMVLRMAVNNYDEDARDFDAIGELWDTVRYYFEMKRDPNALIEYTKEERSQRSENVIVSFRPLVKDIRFPPHYVANVIHSEHQLHQHSDLGFSLMDLSSQNMEGDHKKSGKSRSSCFNSNNFYNEMVQVCTDSMKIYVSYDKLLRKKIINNITVRIEETNLQKSKIISNYIDQSTYFFYQKIRKYANQKEESELKRKIRGFDVLLKKFQEDMDICYPIVRDVEQLSEETDFKEKLDVIVLAMKVSLIDFMDDKDPYQKKEKARGYKYVYKKDVVLDDIIRYIFKEWFRLLNGLRNKTLSSIESNRRRKVPESVRAKVKEELKRKTEKYL